MKNIHPKIFPLTFYSNGSILEKISWYVEIMDPEIVDRIKGAIFKELKESGIEKLSRRDVMKDSIYLDIDDLRDGFDSLRRIVREYREMKI